MYRDPKITMPPETAKIVAQTICEEIKASLLHEENVRRYKRAERCENQTNQVTKWMAQGKVCDVPWKNAADYFVPLTEWTVDAVHARVMNTLFSQEPFMTARGVEASDVAKEDGVTDFVDMAFREIIYLYDNINFFFKQVIKLPFAVLKYDWVCEYDRAIKQENAMILVNQATGEEQMMLPDDPDTQAKMAQMTQAGFMPAGQKQVWVSEDKELINAPRLKYIRFSDYVYSPMAKRGTRLYWEGDRDWFTINQLSLQAQQEKLLADGVDKVKKSQSFTSLGGGVDKIVSQRSALIESFHWYGRLPFNQNNEVDFSSPDAIEQEAYCLVAYKEQELLQAMFWPYRRIPYPERVYIRQEFEETENFEGRSLVEKIYMTNKELNDFMNTIMNNAWLAMQKIFVKKTSLPGEQWNKPKFYPGAIVEEDMQGDIRTLEVGDVKAIGMEIEGMLINFGERVSNISLYQTGTSRDKGQKTKGEVDATIYEGNIGLDKFIQRCHNTLRTICKWTLDYYYDRMPPGLERKIRGENEEMIFPTEENMGVYNQKGVQPYWSQDDITGQFDFTWNGTTLTSSKQYKLMVANDLMERFLPVPMVGGSMLAVWEILRENLRARGVKDYQRFIPPREAIIQEMQKLEMQSRVRKVGGQAGQDGNLKAKIIQKLGEKGMPPEQAQAMVNQKMGAGNVAV